MFAKLKIFLEMIKFEHTIFALPFAYVGAILCGFIVTNQLPTVSETIWITLAMIGARTAAMALNRLIDRTIDLHNPRTSMRALPANLISQRTVIFYTLVSIALLVVSASQLNSTCLYLTPVAVFFLLTYSYSKRFTWLCHYYLGITIAIAPLGGWLALDQPLEWTAWALFIGVALWIAGFDILYALQDEAYDRRSGLFSIPSRFGTSVSLWISRFTHLLAFGSFTALYILSSLSWIFLGGLILSGIILFYEHAILKKDDLSRLNQSFFMMNGLLSVTFFVCTLLDVVILHEF